MAAYYSTLDTNNFQWEAAESGATVRELHYTGGGEHKRFILQSKQHGGQLTYLTVVGTAGSDQTLGCGDRTPLRNRKGDQFHFS